MEKKTVEYLNKKFAARHFWREFTVRWLKCVQKDNIPSIERFQVVVGPQQVLVLAQVLEPVGELSIIEQISNKQLKLVLQTHQHDHKMVLAPQL